MGRGVAGGGEVFPLVAEGVVARWPGAAQPALDGVSLRVEAGERVVIVGPSGAGKSTLVAVLLRLLDAEAGTVTLGGVDTSLMDADAVRRVIGVCPQDVHLFDASVRDNLRIAEVHASDAKLREALAKARLTDWLKGLPEGLHTRLGANGATVSGGQRQRLGLARALLTEAPLLVLDEPGAHLDAPTADALVADLLAATADRATILITHRLAGTEAARTIRLGQGRTLAEAPALTP
jgi:ATP-binding cassette subfamily C protein CydCD